MAHTISFLAITSFLLSLLVTPLCRDIARRLRLFDNPGDPRKIHAQPIPRIGGVAIAISYFACYLPALFMTKSIPPSAAHVYTVVPAALLMFAVGLLDDLISLKPLQKLAGQVAACSIVVLGGMRIEKIGNFPLPAWADAPITMLWLLAATNAFNLIDGIDGLAAGVGLLATLTTLLAALLAHNTALMIATIPLAGALAAFLRYNFNPATIFLGDSGSLLIGFLLGSYGVIWSQKSATLLGMTAPMLALAVPLLEVCISILRRFLRRQPIFGPDRSHIHHRLLDRGLTPRRAALLLYAASAIFATFSLLASFVRERYLGLLVLPLCAVVVLGVQYLGYVEFDLVRKMVMAGGFRRSLVARIAAQKLENALQAADSIDAVWQILQESADEFHFSYLELYTRDHTYHAQLRSADLDRCLVLQVPLPRGWRVSLSHEFSNDESHIAGTCAALFADTVRGALYEKIPQLAVSSELSIPAENALAAKAQ